VLKQEGGEFIGLGDGCGGVNLGVGNDGIPKAITIADVQGVGVQIHLAGKLGIKA
jgi:hypothetical protein